MANIITGAISNPTGFVEEYIRIGIAVGSAVAINKFVERGVDMVLPAQAAPFRGEIVDVVKGTNMVIMVRFI